MDSLSEFFASYGYWGMGIASFLAGTFFPFSSEAVMAALLVSSNMDPFMTVMSGTIGNVVGSMVNYWIGSAATPEHISKWFRIKKSRLDSAQNYVQKYGSWVGFFSFIPILGTAISDGQQSSSFAAKNNISALQFSTLILESGFRYCKKMPYMPNITTDS